MLSSQEVLDRKSVYPHTCLQSLFGDSVLIYKARAAMSTSAKHPQAQESVLNVVQTHAGFSVQGLLWELH